MKRDERQAFERKFARRRVVTMENPYFNGNHDAGPANREKISVVKNIGESAIETLFARGKLDRSQKETGDRFRLYWEMAGGTIQAMDYGREPVDGGGVSEPIGERRADAARQLAACRQKLGEMQYELVVMVCGQGLSLRGVGDDDRARKTAADNLRDALDRLGVMWGIRTKKLESAK